jgi:YggT family protein
VIGTLINLIQTAAWLFTLVIFADVLVSYFLTPYHPVRSMLDRIVQPLLRPIQRMLPSMGGIDFSPLILLLLVQLLENIIVSLLAGIR